MSVVQLSTQRLYAFAMGLLLVQLAHASSFSPPCADTAPASPLTLTAAIDYSLCHQPQTRASWAQAKVQAASLDRSRSALLPTTSANVSASISQSEGTSSNQQSANLQLAYTLFDFGQRDANIAQAQALFDAAQANTDITVASTWLNTSRAYFNVIKVTAQIKANLQAEVAAQTSLAAAERQFKVGSASSLDVLQAQVALSQAALERSKAESQLEINRGLLAQAMGLSPMLLPPVADLPDTTPISTIQPLELDRLLTAAIKNRPEIRQALFNLKAADAAINAANADGKPTLSLSASAGINRNDPPGDVRSSGSISVNLNIPFDFNGAIRAGRNQAQAQKEVREADLERVRQAAEFDAWQVYHTLRSALNTVQAAELVQLNARKASDAALARYQAGLGSVLDVLTAQSNRANAEQQYLNARYDWFTARATLAYAIGGDLPKDPTVWAPTDSPLLK